MNITENFLEQQPEPFDALVQSVSYANTASMKILLQTGDRRQSAMEDIDRRRLGIPGKCKMFFNELGNWYSKSFQKLEKYVYWLK